jgi:hypothetical protein
MDKIKFEPFGCIYFLYQGDTVVYVGQCSNGLMRVFMHNDKQFDHYSYEICSKDKLDESEIAYIKQYQPIYNKTHNDIYSRKGKVYSYMPRIKKVTLPAVRVPVELLEETKQAAELCGYSLSEYIRYAIEERNKKVLKGLKK